MHGIDKTGRNLPHRDIELMIGRLCESEDSVVRFIEAANFRCLRFVPQQLDRFQVIVGPNASGKTSFLDVLAFLRDLASDGVEEAVGRRTSSVYDLIWDRGGTRFELAVEALVPQEHLPPADLVLHNEGYGIRYEVAIGLEARGGKLAILEEQVLVTEDYTARGSALPTVFPDSLFIPPRCRRLGAPSSSARPTAVNTR